MRHSKSLVAILLLASLTFGVSMLSAQAGAFVGEIRGVVSDPSGAVLARARVTALNTDNGATRETTTDSDGIYQFPSLTLGAYKLTVVAPGFGKYEQTGVILTAGAIAT